MTFDLNFDDLASLSTRQAQLTSFTICALVPVISTLVFTFNPVRLNLRGSKDLEVLRMDEELFFLFCYLFFRATCWKGSLTRPRLLGRRIHNRKCNILFNGRWFRGNLSEGLPSCAGKPSEMCRVFTQFSHLSEQLIIFTEFRFKKC